MAIAHRMLRPRLSRLVLALLFFATRDARAGEEGDACAGQAETAQADRSAGRLTEARNRLRACASTPCPLLVRRDCDSWLAEVEDAIPTVVLRASDTAGRDLFDVRVSLDGSPIATRLEGKPFEGNPGEHQLRVEAAGYETTTMRVLFTQGEKNRVLRVTLHPVVTASKPGSNGDASERAPSSRAPVGAYGVGAAGLVSLGVFGALQIVAQGELGDLRDGCGRTHTCAQDDVDALRSQFVASGIALGVGAALIGASIYLFSR